MEVTGDMILRIVEKKTADSPWDVNLPSNRIRWQEKVQRVPENMRHNYFFTSHLLP